MKPNCLWLVMAACGFISACATKPDVVPARTAIPVECKEPIPERPAMPTDALPNDATVDSFVAASDAENKVREGYEIKLLGALTECTKPIESDPS